MMQSSPTTRIGLSGLKELIHRHSRVGDAAAVDAWLTNETLCRYQEWVPAPLAGEARLVDIGCCQPSIGYYFHLGWREVVGIFKEAGDCASAMEYAADGHAARLVQADVEFERVAVDDGWADAVLMMEVMEHFAIDPMHALWEANRVLKTGGRLLLSTPNAASFNNLMRIARGRAPYTTQEFNGFTSNRHNRIYDAEDLQLILRQSGFRTGGVASRSYRESRLPWRDLLPHWAMLATDGISGLFSGHRRERGEWLFLTAVKESAPLERYPKNLYFAFEEWDEWLSTVRGRKIQKETA